MQQEQRLQKEFLGTGFRFPVQVDENTGRMKTASFEEDIKEAIRIILMTKKGERVRRPDFGCGIYDYAFETLDYMTVSAMKREIEQALIQWEPRIEEIEVNILADKENKGKAVIDINYIVRNTNNPYNLVFPYYINEGFGNEM